MKLGLYFLFAATISCAHHTIPYCGEMPGDAWCQREACAEYARVHHWKTWIGFDVWDELGCMCQKTADSEPVFYWPFQRFDAVDAPAPAPACDEEGPYQ